MSKSSCSSIDFLTLQKEICSSRFSDFRIDYCSSIDILSSSIRLEIYFIINSLCNNSYCHLWLVLSILLSYIMHHSLKLSLFNQIQLIFSNSISIEKYIFRQLFQLFLISLNVVNYCVSHIIHYFFAFQLLYLSSEIVSQIIAKLRVNCSH